MNYLHNIYIGVFLVISMLLLNSCYKDQGNYEYDALSKVEIDLGNNGFIGPRSVDTLNIDPILIYKGDTLLGSQSTDLFSFTWYSGDHEISTDPVLRSPVR